MTARISTARLLIAAGALTAAIALAIASSGEPAGAAFPGKNGKIAFDRCLDGKTDTRGIFTIKPSGEGLRKLTGNGSQPSWSANGKKIVFSRAKKNGSAIYTMNAKGKKQHLLTNREDSNPAWSPNGKKIVFVRTKKNGSAIYTMNAKGKKQHRLTNREDSNPAWSPNGKKIVFVRTKKNGSAIYTMNAKGKKQHRLTKPSLFQGGPVWSPNGKWIAFFRDARQGQGAVIYTMNSKGKKLTKLTGDDTTSTTPDWSPDGKQITFERDFNIYTMKVNGKQVEPVTSGGPGKPGLGGYVPAWSPDGTEIAFAGFREPTGSLGIFRIGADGSDPVELTVPPKTKKPCGHGEADNSADWQPR
jgi:TolB protein